MVRFDGQLLTLPVLSMASPEEREAARQHFPGAPQPRHGASGRAILERRIIHIHDVRDDPEYTATPIQRTTLGYRTVLAVPLLRDAKPIGALVMWRRDVRPFSQKQIDLMTTFADQAVIAIENVRLFKELEARNRDLTDSARAADRNERDPARHLELADRCPAGLRHDSPNAVRLCDGQFCFVLPVRR